MREGLAGAVAGEFRELHRLHRAVGEPGDDVVATATAGITGPGEDDPYVAVGQLLPEVPLALGDSTDLAASPGPPVATEATLVGGYR
jgi:hypothetical protein